MACTGGKRNAHRILVGKEPLGRSKTRWEDQIKMDYKEIGHKGTDQTDLVQDGDKSLAVVNTVMNICVP